MSDCIRHITSAVVRLEIKKMWKQSGPDDVKSLLQHVKNLRRTGSRKNFKLTVSLHKNKTSLSK